MKTESYGYNEQEIDFIVKSVIPLMEQALTERLERPEDLKTEYEYPTCSYKPNKTIHYKRYFMPIKPFHLDFNNHSMMFANVEAVFRIYWRLTGKKYLGTEDLKGLYELKNPSVDNAIPFINGGRCPYSNEVSRWMTDKLDINTNEIKPEGCLLLEDVIE